MANLKIAAWNIYFSWKLVSKRNGRYTTLPKHRDRAASVGQIINDMDAAALGIVECMNEASLEYFCSEYCPAYDGVVLNEDRSKYNIGLIYKRDLLEVRKLGIDTDLWKARIGNDRRKKTYRFTRPPLVVRLTERSSGRSIIMCTVHLKSKRPKDVSRELPAAERRRIQDKEAVQNRKRIVAEVYRIRELLYRNYDRFMVLGDINDGPDFDRFEQKIWRSGIESLLGSVLDPDNILQSFVDLSDGKGVPTSSFRRGTIQLDHIVYTPNMRYSRDFPKIRRNSGVVRSDLVDLSSDGKDRDSDHAPVEVIVRF